MKDKRQVAAYIPYKRMGEHIAFFLQKRDMKAARLPGVFGMFGGGLDKGESREQGLMREVQEELTYVPVRPLYFSRYETADHAFDLFIEEVSADFEEKIKVEEGEYGKFFTAAEIANENVSATTRLVIPQLEQFLLK